MEQLAIIFPQLYTSLPYPNQDFTGQTIIVTGSNTGLGLEAARHFSRLNVKKLILAVRSLDKGEAAKKSIESSTNRTGVVEVWKLDLSSFESVKSFAKKVETLERLDAVLENASILKTDFTVLENHEATITVNVISTFLLGLLVLPKLRESAKLFNIHPRLTIVVSELHAIAKFKERVGADNLFDALDSKAIANMSERYEVSKLLQVLLAKQLASNLRDDSVIVNMVCPGFCHSELTREVEASSAAMMIRILKGIFARTSEQGSRNFVYAVNGGLESNGEYFSVCKIAKMGDFVSTPEGKDVGKRLWKELCVMLENISPGVVSNI